MGILAKLGWLGKKLYQFVEITTLDGYLDNNGIEREFIISEEEKDETINLRLENSMVNIKPIKQKKKKFPKPKNNQFQLSKKKNKFIYERNSRLNNKSYRRY